MRIELGEIESVLTACQGVQTASVKVVTNPLTKQATIVAYLNPASLDPRSILQEAKKKLPKHMAPQTTVLMTSMPLMPSGKVNQAALPEPSWEAGAEGDVFVEPRSDLERIIHNVWTGVLGTAKISVQADFFEAGGTSMLAGELCLLCLDHLKTLQQAPKLQFVQHLAMLFMSFYGSRQWVSTACKPIILKGGMHANTAMMQSC